MKTFSSKGCGDSNLSDSELDRRGRSLSRQPSLADIPTITSNCSSSPIMTRGKDSQMDRESRSQALDSAIARTENTIALLASQTHDTREKYLSLVPATPPKPANNKDPNAQTSTVDEPLTPTANLKMLVSAASPAIRDRESKKRELFTDSSESEPPSPNNPCVVPSFALPMFDSKVVYRNGNFVHLNPHDGTEKMAISRKDKSLGLLCQRFLAKYPENPLPEERIEISLDEVAKDLSVERRRIYDIVNVLESVEVISRFAKNRYMWHGKTKLPQTLAKLKHYAMTHGFSSKGGSSEKENPTQNYSSKSENTGRENPSNNIYYQLKGSKTNEKLPQLLPKNTKLYVPGLACLSSVFDSEEDEVMTWARKQKEADYCRKDKSLGVLSQKFLMMFLISDTRQVTLDDAANLLIDEQEEGKAKYKTKVRRLYDIANILSSLQLIQKVHIHNIQSGRKPGFRWIGMDLDKLEMQKKQPKLANPPKKAMASKNSLVEKEIEEESAFGRLISRRPSQQQLRCTKSDRGTKSKLPRSRSDRILTCKKRVLSCDDENVPSNKEDGYSVQEITGIKGDAIARSPDSVKFHTELMKLKQQYPDRMSQLLSACTSLQSVPTEDKKSRRTLFVSEAYIDAPMPKRRKSTDDLASKDKDANNTAKFIHSFTSPFKPFNNDKSTMAMTAENPQDSESLGLKQGSPEQKILLERKKQKKLLEEQKNFQLEDERWKRMEHELDKAFPKPESVVRKSDSSNIFDKFHPSVGIQANLIADVSPLKPLSHYVQSLPLPNYAKNGSETQAKQNTSATSSPVRFQNMAVSPLVSKSLNALTASQNTVVSTAGDVPSSINVQNVKLVSLSSASLPSLWTMSTHSIPPLQTTQPSLYLTVPQQQVLSSALCHPTSLAPVQSTSAVMSSLPSEQGNCFSNVMQMTSEALQPSSVTLPMNIVNSLSAQGLIQKSTSSLQDHKITRPLIGVQQHLSQGFAPRMTMDSVPNIQGIRPLGMTPNQMTPILPKVMQQQLFSPIASGTPGSSTSFLHSDIAKKLVMSESKLTQC